MCKHAKRVLLLALVTVYALPVSLHRDHLSVWLFAVDLLQRVSEGGTSRVRVMSRVHAGIFPGLTWSWRWQIFILVWLRVGHIISVDLAESTPGSTACGLRAIGWSGYLSIADETTWRLRAGLPGCQWFRGFELCLYLVLKVPFSELSLIQVQPVLLWPDHHSRPHEAHECNDFVGGETVTVDEVRANQTSCPS